MAAGSTPVDLVAELAAQSFDRPEQAVDSLLGVLQQIIGFQTVLISDISRERSTLRIHAVRNSDPALTVPPGLEIPLTASPCQHVASSVSPFMSADMQADAGLAVLPAAKDMGAKSYIGVPILLADGSFFGTLVGLDTGSKDQPHEYILWMQILARLAALHVQRQTATASV
jgi:GAF domain-containing protein